jgi:hypothetical protein
VAVWKKRVDEKNVTVWRRGSEEEVSKRMWLFGDEGVRKRFQKECGCLERRGGDGKGHQSDCDWGKAGTSSHLS